LLIQRVERHLQKDFRKRKKKESTDSCYAQVQ
jgi:hypothetical protein